MALHFPFRVLSVLFVIGSLSSAESSKSVQHSTSETSRIPTINIGRSFATLYGPWKFQTGDSPIDPETSAPLWAEPGFDDSNWETVDLTPKPSVVNPTTLDPEWVPGWRGRGHLGYSGWAWYRIRLRITAQPGIQLALNGPNDVNDAYQAFTNGQLIGSQGDFRKYPNGPPAELTPMSMFLLPTEQPADDAANFLTLAFRVWLRNGGPASVNSGGMHTAPQLGDADTIRVLHDRDWKKIVIWNMAAPFETAMPLLLGMVAASLLLFDRTDRAYIWLAAVLLFNAVSTAYWLGLYFPQLLSFITIPRFQGIFYRPLYMGGWTMVWWHWFRCRRPSWVPWAAGALTILYMLASALYLSSSPLNPSEVPYAATIVVRLLFFSLLVLIVSKAIPNYGLEALLVLPAIVLMLPMQFMSDLVRFHLRAFWRVFGIGISTNSISNDILGAVVALLLLRRLLLTVRREKRMVLDIKQAQEVQQVILPEQRTILPGMIVDCEFHPALEVGGDFFQVIPHPEDGSLLIVAGDVTGKGLQAGMLVALLVGAIRTLAESDPDPLTILAMLNQHLHGRRHAHATCLALRIAANGEATLANAGHLPPYLNGEPLNVEGSLPLGIVEHPEFSIANFFVTENDRLVLLSDGVVEAADGERRLFGFERFEELLKHGATAADITAAAQRFGQQDDISVISVSRVALREAVSMQNLGAYPLSSKTS